MKFKKDGKIFDNVTDLIIELCKTRNCDTCEFNGVRLRHYNLHHEELDCATYCVMYPEEAGELMGFEAIRGNADRNLLEMINETTPYDIS